MKSKIIILFILFSLFFLAAFSFAANEKKETGIWRKVVEFLSLLLDLLIKLFQLIQDFFGLIIKFLNWLKQQISTI